MKAIEKYFQAVLFAVLYKVVQTHSTTLWPFKYRKLLTNNIWFYWVLFVIRYFLTISIQISDDVFSPSYLIWLSLRFSKDFSCIACLNTLTQSVSNSGLGADWKVIKIPHQYVIHPHWELSWNVFGFELKLHDPFFSLSRPFVTKTSISHFRCVSIRNLLVFWPVLMLLTIHQTRDKWVSRLLVESVQVLILRMCRKELHSNLHARRYIFPWNKTVICDCYGQVLRFFVLFFLFVSDCQRLAKPVLDYGRVYFLGLQSVLQPFRDNCFTSFLFFRGAFHKNLKNLECTLAHFVAARFHTSCLHYCVHTVISVTWYLKPGFHWRRKQKRKHKRKHNALFSHNASERKHKRKHKKKEKFWSLCLRLCFRYACVASENQASVHCLYQDLQMCTSYSW